MAVRKAVWVFSDERARQRSEWVLQELTAIQITPSTELLPLIGRFLEIRSTHNRWNGFWEPIWLDKINYLSRTIKPVPLFHELGELVANEPEFYRPNLHKMIKFLRLEHERQRKGSREEKWLEHWQIEQIESPKIPPHRSLRTLADGARTDFNWLIAD